MTLKKLIILISLIPTGALAQISNSWIIPPPYYQGQHFLENHAVQVIEEDKEGIIFMYGTKNQITAKSSSLWMTKCYKSLEKGISVTSCLIQNPSEKNVRVLVNANNSIVLLSPLKTKIKEINYKINNNQIISSNGNYMLNKNFQFKLLSNLLSGNKLTYSYKVNQSYQTNEVSLEGFAENYNFSLIFIKNN